MAKKKIQYNFYNLYLLNLRDWVLNYGFEYEWSKIGDKTWINCSGVDFRNWECLENPYIQKWKSDRLKLAEDILQRGMFAPFFIYGDNKVFMGKHRVWSLWEYNKIAPIEKEFLFLKYPTDPKGVFRGNSASCALEIPGKDFAGKNYTWNSFDQPPELIKVRSYYALYNLILYLGDSLTDFLYNNDIQPSPVINNKEDFEKFLKGEIQLSLKM